MSAVFEVVNGAGKRYGGSNCPLGFRPAIERSIERGQTSGTVAGGGPKVADNLSRDSKLFQHFLVSHPEGTTMIGHLARFKVLVTTLLLKRWYSTP
jgi:hypothetical protein